VRRHGSSHAGIGAFDNVRLCSIRNLRLNTGHGHMGWTMAAGSSRMVVDRLLGRDPAIDDKPFALARY